VSEQAERHCLDKATDGYLVGTGEHLQKLQGIGDRFRALTWGGHLQLRQVDVQ
jgi:hypothetical protein